MSFLAHGTRKISLLTAHGTRKIKVVKTVSNCCYSLNTSHMINTLRIHVFLKMLSFHRNLSVFAQNIWLLHKVYENWSQMYFHKIYRCEFRDFEDFFLWKKYLWRKYVCITLLKAKAYSGPCETSMMEIFSETIDYIIIF